MQIMGGPSPLWIVLCALVPGCYLAHEPIDDTPRMCATDLGGGCRGWEAAGPAVLISETEVGVRRVTDSVDAECGVFVAWGLAQWNGVSVQSETRIETRSIDWAGVPAAPIVPRLWTLEDWPNELSWARRSDGAALIVPMGGGCIFDGLTRDGVERGAPVQYFTRAEGCSALAPTEAGYSFLIREGAASALRSVPAPGWRALARACRWRPSSRSAAGARDGSHGPRRDARHGDRDDARLDLTPRRDELSLAK